VLSDTLWHDTAVLPTAGGTTRALAAEQPPRKSRNYGDAAFMDEEPRLTDLVPTRLPAMAAVMLAGLAVIAGLELLYSWMPELAPMTSDGRVAAIDLDGEGSLAVWFSSMILAAAGLVAVVVYRVRQHRSDDYHGRYRIWLWAAMCWFLMSLDETASLHEGFKEMMACVTGTRILGDGSLWWIIAYGFLLGGVGMRLLLDMRECAASTAAMIATAGCYGLAVVAQLGWVMPDSGAKGVMLEEGAEMVGSLMLLMAMILHARHVILDAQGLLPERKPRRGTRMPAGPFDEPEDDRLAAFEHPVVVHPPHGVSRPVAAAATGREPSRPAFAPKPAEAAQTPPASASRKLTKAERKALRKRLRQMALERERRAKEGGH